jgi:hypothetical protein
MDAYSKRFIVLLRYVPYLKYEKAECNFFSMDFQIHTRIGLILINLRHLRILFRRISVVIISLSIRNILQTKVVEVIE